MLMDMSMLICKRPAEIVESKLHSRRNVNIRAMFPDTQGQRLYQWDLRQDELCYTRSGYCCIAKGTAGEVQLARPRQQTLTDRLARTAGGPYGPRT